MRELQIGDIISTPAYGIINHWGVYTGNGFVISNSQRHGRVVEESMTSFRNGKALHYVGYLGILPGDEVVARARQLIGKKWNLVKSNCEHFAHHAHGVKLTSPQLLLGTISLAAVALLVFGR